MNTKIISVVVPCYNEEEVINETYNRLIAIFDKLRDFSFELIFIDDGSIDKTLSLLKTLHEKDDRIRILNFSRNFGHQAAVTAGIDYSIGDAVVLIDADLQDPPEIIPQMIERWMIGIEVVYAVRKKRKETFPKRVSYYLFYRLLAVLSDTNIPFVSGDFCLMDRCVVEQLKQLPESKRFIRGLRSWVGFKQEPLEYERSVRFAGKPKYTVRKLIKLAFDGMFSFSYAPLRIAIILGSIVSGLAFLEGLRIIYLKLFVKEFIPGLAALSIFILFIGGIILLFIGLIGEYIGRIYDEVKGRPTYIIRRNIDSAEK